MARLSTTRRGLIAGLAMLGVAGLAELYVPRRRVARMTDKRFEALFPLTVGPWQYLTASGLVLPPQDQLSKALYEQLLTRIYGNPRGQGADGEAVMSEADAVMMVVAYSSVQEGRLQVHRPEVCYPAAGFTITRNDVMRIPLGGGVVLPCRFLIAQRGDRQECILYWVRVGEELPTRWTEQRIAMAVDNLRGYIPDGLLGRVSVISGDPATALATLQSFLSSLVGSASRTGRSLLIGAR